MWERAKKAINDPDSALTMTTNSIACIDAIMEQWTLKNVQAEWNKLGYNWGLTHGDFHAGQIMVNPNDFSDMIFVDWEFTGI